MLLNNFGTKFNKYLKGGLGFGDWGFGDWGLGIGDWGLGPIPNTQTPNPNSLFTKPIIF